MTLNLVQHRAEPSIWDQTNRLADWDTERWTASLIAGAMLVSGFRRRSLPGLLLVIAGGGLAWWASSAPAARRGHRGRLGAALRRTVEGDAVHEAAEESFPASDAPSWTPTTGNTAGPSRTADAR